MQHTNTPDFSLDDGDPVVAAADQLIEQMPEPTGLVTDEELDTGTTAGDTQNVDSAGVAFDPAKHTGTKLKSGRWREKRKPKQVTDPRAPQAPAAASVGAPVINEEELKLAAESAAASIFMLGMLCGGEEWQPLGDDGKLEPVNEKSLVTMAFQDYFRAKGITKLPPSTSLMLALGGYAVPRFFMPKTKERVSGAKTWFGVRLAKWKLKREFKKRGINAAVSIRGSRSTNVYDSILIDGKPYNEVYGKAAAEKKP